ncbi:hypothetical protein GR253_15935 [Rhizobium leguminosarum]|nr:hypothetical protein [Rhizobium leguminosarum]
MADRKDLSVQQKASAEDAPEPLRMLLAKRGDAPVLRYDAEGQIGTLTRYYSDGSSQQLAISALSYGTGRACIPRYLLIWGNPTVVPWSVQYELQTGYFVGRLDLEGNALARYVAALVDEWKGKEPVLANTTVWAVDHGTSDITHLMLKAVAVPIHDEFKKDIDPEFNAGARLLIDQHASCTALMNDLAERRPSLVVTSSHGATGPLSDVEQMRKSLGLMVDRDHTLLDVERLLEVWEPSGAIWFGQACCSAGSAEATAYERLVAPDSAVGRILTGVARCGSIISPLPRSLLGAEVPLRAFVGHVEPTFDWTLRHPRTNQFLTRPLIRAFYNHLFLGKPVGMALAECRIAASSLNESYRIAVDSLRNGEDLAGEVFALELMSKDWRSLVLLGDPTCRLLNPPTAVGR